MENGKSQVVQNSSSVWIDETTVKMESEAGQRRGLVQGDNEDWGDDHLEFIKDDENVSEEEENDKDNADDGETLKYTLGFRSLISLFLYLDICLI